jgi:hypothetical protein
MADMSLAEINASRFPLSPAVAQKVGDTEIEGDLLNTERMNLAWSVLSQSMAPEDVTEQMLTDAIAEIAFNEGAFRRAKRTEDDARARQVMRYRLPAWADNPEIGREIQQRFTASRADWAAIPGVAPEDADTNVPIGTETEWRVFNALYNVGIRPVGEAVGLDMSRARTYQSAQEERNVEAFADAVMGSEGGVIADRHGVPRDQMREWIADDWLVMRRERKKARDEAKAAQEMASREAREANAAYWTNLRQEQEARMAELPPAGGTGAGGGR